MDMLKRMKAGAKAEKLREGKRKAKEEVGQLFNYSKRKKGEAVKKMKWKHKFVCLAYRDQPRIPTSEVEKDDLLQSGLGEKEIVFYDLHIHHQTCLSRELEMLGPIFAPSKRILTSVPSSAFLMV